MAPNGKLVSVNGEDMPTVEDGGRWPVRAEFKRESKDLGKHWVVAGNKEGSST
jgi:hypothetical protein